MSASFSLNFDLISFDNTYTISHSTPHRPRSAGRTATRREDDLIAGVETPGDAVELQVDLVNLAGAGDAEEVKALYFVFTRADALEVPVPQHLGAASNQDLDGIDALDWGCIEDAVDVLRIVSYC